MKLTRFFMLIVALSVFSACTQNNCLSQEHLKTLDASWEKAQLELDYDFIESLLAEDFIWVHNHAKTIDDKEAVLERVKRHIANNNTDTKSRISKDVNIIISEKSAIVSGYTIIDRGPSPTTYHFMRTYVDINGKCYLIANHTMAIPDKPSE
jgi:vacuolar-type H+-ATPase catalytic subunit A/Vma1